MAVVYAVGHTSGPRLNRVVIPNAVKLASSVSHQLVTPGGWHVANSSTLIPYPGSNATALGKPDLHCIADEHPACSGNGVVMGSQDVIVPSEPVSGRCDVEVVIVARTVRRTYIAALAVDFVTTRKFNPS